VLSCESIEPLEREEPVLELAVHLLVRRPQLTAFLQEQRFNLLNPYLLETLQL
jgi:hypothetical protein